jgi:Putative glycolipid-binding
VPAGRYAVMGNDGARACTEEFRCAPGPMGWRYFSDIQTTGPTAHVETFDVVVDRDWRPVRIRIGTGEHQLMLETHGGSLTGGRDGVTVELPWEPDRHLDYFTPATNLITTRRLTDTTDIDVVYLAPVTLEPTLVRQRYELIGREDVETPVGRFAAARWRYTSLDDGWTSDLWVAGDVVVRYDRLFELEWYEAGASGPQPSRA